jgi:hypothetical protein
MSPLQCRLLHNSIATHLLGRLIKTDELQLSKELVGGFGVEEILEYGGM